jgi:hypothetical protein
VPELGPATKHCAPVSDLLYPPRLNVVPRRYGYVVTASNFAALPQLLNERKRR